ncbi:conserved hypothetical protein [Talaromyces stipitatus ATCC 10500]|uniref:Uncharacterized protein n=1 Tax=Talaromyces stipitatus (strain ATCC 10500 / CBS 375.48 / QM 6759 / NRRL 1006) TaxID=441959 RepID=B8LYB7_TALSN|nr:uncharacterized protein TSTA_063280 [Talaromyces stipitatus ATCC 10500]EED22846.1 conserved hypothetical protein [Talaromyces stipitatus ATCC 10500]
MTAGSMWCEPEKEKSQLSPPVHFLVHLQLGRDSARRHNRTGPFSPRFLHSLQASLRTIKKTQDEQGVCRRKDHITSIPIMPSETTFSPETVESEIYNHLLSDSSTALDDLHANLLFSLQRAGWTERVQSLSLELLRAGRCTHFDDMVDVVVTLATGQTHPIVPEANNNTTTNGHEKNSSNGTATAANGVNNATSSESFFRDIDVRIPKEVVEQGVRSLKDSLRSFATIEDDDDGGPEVDDKELTNGKASKSEKEQTSQWK